MKKLLLLLLLIPNLVMAEVCFVHDGKNFYDKLQACKDGDQLHYEKITETSIKRNDAKANFISTRAYYCDLRYEAYIGVANSYTTLTCVFKNHNKE